MNTGRGLALLRRPLHQASNTCEGESAEGDPREGDNREQNVALLSSDRAAELDVVDDGRESLADVLSRPLVGGDRTADEEHDPGDASPEELRRQRSEAGRLGLQGLEDGNRSEENRQASSDQQLNDDWI